jgi:hypothetical protein
MMRKDTKSLVEEPTLTIADFLFSDSSGLSAGNATITSEGYCYEIEADEPQFNDHGLKIMIPKQELPIIICTSDTIGTVCSQRLF